MDITRRASFTKAALLAAPVAFALAGEAAAQEGVATVAFGAWLDRYKQAWEGRDSTLVGALFSEDAIYHEMPYDAPLQGRAAIEAYWTRVTATQRDIVFTYEVLACTNNVGTAHWHAAFTSTEGGAAIELDGVFVCTFADAQTVSALREWWHLKVTPPA